MTRLRTGPPRSRRSTTKHQALYDTARWRKASRRFRDANPLCCDCQARGKIVESEITDHVIPHDGDERLFWDPENWQALCASHHAIKSRADEVEARTGKRPPRRGCDQRGVPVDPSHHWHTS